MSCKIFLEKISLELGTDRIVDPLIVQAQYGASTVGARREIPGVVRPCSRQEVETIVRLSCEQSVPLYPISTGNNWGYGGALPAKDGCIIVDLSRLTKVSVDPENGLAIVEPGVTQRILRKYLDDNALSYLCPVTGAGPDCSLIGNALERGHGITPYVDHFLSVMSLEAVLPDGRIYRPPLTELGCPEIDRMFKWGVGPFLDGIFSQGAFGIVTEMTIALAPTPARIEAFFFSIPEDNGVESAVGAVRDILRDFAGEIGAINLMDRTRVISMMEPYPRDHLNSDGLIEEEYLLKIAKKNQVTAWMGAGAIYGNARVVRAVKTEIKKRLRGVVRRLVFFTPQSVQRFRKISHYIPGEFGHGLQNIFATLDKTLQALAGAPSEVALPLSYWISGQMPQNQTPMNPDRDGCGLRWYAPLVQMRPECVRGFVEMVRRVCTEFHMEPLITLTSLSHHCFVSSIPLLFDQNSEEARRRAFSCYKALIEAGRKIGIFPYRASSDSMKEFIKPGTPYWQIVAALKRELDPQGLMAPGRYSESDQVNSQKSTAFESELNPKMGTNKSSI